MPVKTWGDFEVFLDRCIGRGGMGAVYMGRQVSVDRPAAVKLLSKHLTENPEFVARFHREASLLARLVDAHVVQVFGAGEAEGSHFYAMEFVKGEDLAALMKKGHAFAVDEILQVALSVGVALQAAWRHRIVHRDIKPSNILVTEDRRIKVMDFGLAKAAGSDLTQSEVIMGTAKYMSPEQATGGALDIRSDLYSLGVVLYEMSTGKAPFVGETPTSIMYQHVHQAPRPPREANPALPLELETLILRLMAKDPQARYASPEALVSTVQAILDGVTPEEKSTLYNETVLAAPPRREEPAVRPAGSGPLVVALLAALLLAGGGAYYFFVVGLGAPPVPLVRTADPPPPAPDPVPPAPTRTSSWEEPLRRANEALARREWGAATAGFEEAARRGAPDLEEKLREARAGGWIARGDEEKDDERAVEAYEAARKLLPSEEVDRKLARASFRRWSKLAEKNEGGDWGQAAVEWGRAIPFAEEGLRAELEVRRKFCLTYAEALRAKTNGDWKAAYARFQDLARDPRGYAAAIDAEFRRAKEEVDRLAVMAKEELRKEFERTLDEGRAACRRAAWAEAKAAFARAGEPRFAEFPRDPVQPLMRDVDAALAAPPGMIYVPGGEFKMGGGRDVEGPQEGDAKVAAFYLDEREVTAGEYAEFVKALGESGHHAGCPEGEPSGKRHGAEDLASQRPEEPVVDVDWWDAASYAAWRKKRLPREAEWERAASFDPSGRRAYPWGPRWQKEGGRSYLGLAAMGDGVIEWTSNWFQKYPWSEATHVDFGEKMKVLRGGVLLGMDAERDAKTNYRRWYLPSYRSRKVGFRCAQDAGVKPTEER